MQNVLGYSAVQAGAAFLPMTMLIILARRSRAASRPDRLALADGHRDAARLVPAPPASPSSAVDATYLDLLPGAPARRGRDGDHDDAELRGRDPRRPVDKAGVGSAVLNACRQVGGSVGHRADGRDHGRRHRCRDDPGAFMQGFERALLTAAGIAIVGAVVAGAARPVAPGIGRPRVAARVRRPRPREPADAPRACRRRHGERPRTSRRAAAPVRTSGGRRSSTPRSSVFARRATRGATTAAIARRAGVSEPILYRHFPSKRDLCLACLDEAWQRLSTAIERGVACRSGCMSGLRTSRRSGAAARCASSVSSLWVVALTESGEDDVIAARLRDHLREVHDLDRERLRGGARAGDDAVRS